MQRLFNVSFREDRFICLAKLRLQAVLECFLQICRILLQVTSSSVSNLKSMLHREKSRFAALLWMKYTTRTKTFKSHLWGMIVIASEVWVYTRTLVEGILSKSS